MTCASPAESLISSTGGPLGVITLPPAASPAIAPRVDTQADTHDLGESIALLAARLHAATYELLVMLGEFDRRKGWTNGFLSCAHWLHWRTGIDLGAAREKVRVARALVRLPLIGDHVQRGQLSYAKVRALTRVATPATERRLVNFALGGTAAQVERFVRAWRRVDRAQEGEETERRHLRRELSVWTDDGGMVVIRGRLSPEAGAVVQRALEAAADRLFQEGRSTPTGGTLTEEVSAAQRRADALALLAETALSAGLDSSTAGDRYQVIVHVTAPESTRELAAAPSTATTEAASGIAESDDGGVLEVDHGARGAALDRGRVRLGGPRLGLRPASHSVCLARPPFGPVGLRHLERRARTRGSSSRNTHAPTSCALMATSRAIDCCSRAASVRRRPS